jgi:lactate dehydrogenase-like 2-hydroxyacid dehydrogenase
MKPLVLVLVYITEEHRELVAESFEMIYAPNAALGADRSAGLAQMAAHGSKIRAVLTNGTNGLTPAEIDTMPKLEIICTLGVGYENVAVDYARARGIAVANAAFTNDDTVADHAMMILLAAIRNVIRLDRLCRQGVWRDDMPRPPHISHRRLGILGLGVIGQQIARRAEGFDLEIGYHNRSRKPDVAYSYFNSVMALAQWADYLVVAAPGGPSTRHIINAEVLRALGPEGVLVNIARGTLVDTAALAVALREGHISAAALDVYEGEPVPPAALLEMDNVVLTPHIAGISPDAIHASVQRFIDNTTRHFAGEPLISPVTVSHTPEVRPA